MLRSLGGENSKPELSELTDVSRGSHAFLLCTDGFWEYVYEEEMEQTLAQAKDPDDWIARMEKILLSRVNGNNDNYSASVVFINAPGAAGLPRMRKGASKKKKGGILITLVLLLLAAGIGVSALLLPGVRKEKPHEDSPKPTVQTEAAAPAPEETEMGIPEAFETLMPTIPETEPVTLPAEPSSDSEDKNTGEGFMDPDLVSDPNDEKSSEKGNNKDKNPAA